MEVRKNENPADCRDEREATVDERDRDTQLKLPMRGNKVQRIRDSLEAVII